MERKEIQQIIIESASIVFRKQISEITEETRLVEDLRSKSINLFQLQVMLEGKLGIKLIFAELKKNVTIADMVKMIEGILEA